MAVLAAPEFPRELRRAGPLSFLQQPPLFRRVLLESDRLSTQWLSPPKLTLSGCESGRPSCDNAA